MFRLVYADLNYGGIMKRFLIESFKYVVAIVVMIVVAFLANMVLNLGYSNAGVTMSREEINSLEKVYVVKQFSFFQKKYNVYNENKELIGQINGQIVGRSMVDSLTFTNVDGEVIASMSGVNKSTFPITSASYHEGEYSSNVSGEMNWNMKRLGYNYDLTGNGFGIDSEVPKFFYSATYTSMGTQCYTINREVNLKKVFVIKKTANNNEMAKVIMLTTAANRMEDSK